MTIQHSFLQELDQLNEKQRIAVDTLEGPVMVIAGPGTGKTQILAARIGNILLTPETQAAPGNILCLTYTDAGAVAMRKRLLQFIGPDAYRVHIHTFHAFCNLVIQENMESFGLRSLDPITELEKVQLLREIVDEFPAGHPLKRYSGDVYYEVRRLDNLFSQMKRENFTPEGISAGIDKYIEDLPLRDAFIYQRNGSGYKKGDLKVKLIEAEQKSMEQLRAAAFAFHDYTRKMQERGRYDFDDMIQWVIGAFNDNADLLRRYQEQFLYVLVDEFQDTSGAQYYLLQQLISYWDIPNVFVVGDDDQSIYSFQGANLRNLAGFIDKFGGSVQTVTLDRNYRSSQLVLDTARALISHNQSRLSNSKILTASNPAVADLPVKPQIRAYFNDTHELAGIANDILELQQKGINLAETAVIYRNHRQAEELARYLQDKQVPIHIRKRVNVLEEPVICRLLDLLKYLALETDRAHSGEYLLFRLMHHPYFNIAPVEAARFSMEMSRMNFGDKRKPWREVMQAIPRRSQQDLFSQVESKEQVRRFSDQLEKWIQDTMNHTLQQMVELLVSETGMLHILVDSPDRMWQMELLHNFFNFLKDETMKQPLLTIKGFIELTDLMQRHEISLPLYRVNFSENGVNFLTAHSSKGLEFDYVFVLGCNSNTWDKAPGLQNQFKFPDTLVPQADDDSEEHRRLFYVALTRARKHLVVSYAERDAKERSLEKSRFVAEIDQLDTVETMQVHLDEPRLFDFMVSRNSREVMPGLELMDKNYLDHLLKDYSLSVTHLSAYLKCPISFYFNNLLRVPQAKSAALTFGSAAHHALDQLFKKMLADTQRVFPPVNVFMRDFEWYMTRHRDAFTDQEFARRMEQGFQILPNYYDKYMEGWNKVVVTEYRIRSMEAFGIPVNGMLDKLEFTGNEVNVVDYKTGKYDTSKFKRPDANVDTETAPFESVYGGDYWRQAVFYKILMDHDRTHLTWNMISAEFDFLEPDRKDGEFKKFRIMIEPGDIDLVRVQMKEAYDGIMAHRFSKGCGSPDCEWCNFMKR